MSLGDKPLRTTVRRRSRREECKPLRTTVRRRSRREECKPLRTTVRRRSRREECKPLQTLEIQKVLNQAQSGRLALLRVELTGHNRAKFHGTRKVIGAVIGAGRNHGVI
jgi:hypothetical protein